MPGSEGQKDKKGQAARPISSAPGLSNPAQGVVREGKTPANTPSTSVSRPASAPLVGSTTSKASVKKTEDDEAPTFSGRSPSASTSRKSEMADKYVEDLLGKYRKYKSKAKPTATPRRNDQTRPMSASQKSKITEKLMKDLLAANKKKSKPTKKPVGANNDEMTKELGKKSRVTSTTSIRTEDSSQIAESIVQQALSTTLSKFGKGRSRRQKNLKEAKKTLSQESTPSSGRAESIVRTALNKSTRNLCKKYMCKKIQEDNADPDWEDEVCGLEKGKEAQLSSPISPLLRLGVRRKTRIDHIRDRIPLKVYLNVPPLLSTGLNKFLKEDRNCAQMLGLFLSRGKLGKGLTKCHPFYTVFDENNQKRVITSPYTTLHDPHLKQFFKSRPNAKELLRQQDLISPCDDVVCSLRDFNDYRKYLDNLRIDDIRHNVKKEDAMWMHQRKLLKKIRLSFHQKRCCEKQGLLNLRKEKERASLVARRHQLKNLEAIRKHRLRMQRDALAKEHLLKILLANSRMQRNAERVEDLKDMELYRRRSILTMMTIKEIAFEYQKQEAADCADNCNNPDEETVKLKRDLLKGVLKYRKMAKRQREAISEVMENELYENALRRQRKIELMRKMLPILIEKRKKEAERKLKNVKKFAMRWLNKVRTRLKAPKDELHESLWTGRRVPLEDSGKERLEDTVEYLRNISGYKKMDDLVTNLLDLIHRRKKCAKLPETSICNEFPLNDDELEKLAEEPDGPDLVAEHLVRMAMAKYVCKDCPPAGGDLLSSSQEPESGELAAKLVNTTLSKK